MSLVQGSLNDPAPLGSVCCVSIEQRAAIHAALGDPVRLAVVDELRRSDRSPGELGALLGVPGPLLAFHLDALERAGVIRRRPSSGDRRRRYVQLVGEVLDLVAWGPTAPARPVLFVCTRNSARSQLAAAIWRAEIGSPASSAGTDPAQAIHPGAVEAARRAGLPLGDTTPSPLPHPLHAADDDTAIVTVCDRAREELAVVTWHWSIPDPADDGSDAAFDDAVARLRDRIRRVGRDVGAATSPRPRPLARPAARPPQEDA